MSLQDKIIQHFEGKVVRKDLTKAIKGNAVVPTYVLNIYWDSIVLLLMRILLLKD